MEYAVVFDVAREGYRNWWCPVVGLCFVFLATTSALVGRRSSERFSTRDYLAIGFTVLCTALVAVGTFSDYWHLRSSLVGKYCEVTEGVVSEFHPIPFNGRGTEWFVVNHRRFSYTPFQVTAGFNTYTSHGGPIREGIKVRISHAANEIARLEVVE